MDPLSAEPDAPLAARTRAALGCKFSAGGFSLTCEPYKRWLDGLDGARSDGLLVTLLESPEVERRYMGAAGLLRRGRAYRTDPALGMRVIAAARTERHAAVTRLLGAVVARLDIGHGPINEAIPELLREHPDPALRAGLVGDLLPVQGGAWFDATRQVATTDTSSEVKLAALSAFWISGTDRAGEVCGIWATHTDDSDLRIAEKTAYLLAFWGRCASHYDALLEQAEARAARGAMTWAWFASVEALHAARDATSDHKAAAIAAAKATAETLSNGWSARSRALELVAREAPDGEAFVARFGDDGEPRMRDKARELSP